jgi:glutaminyl-peptide cyclotransferase
MLGKQILIFFLAVGSLLAQAKFSGASALEYTRRVVALGPRPVGSDAYRKAQVMIIDHLRKHGWEVIEDSFTAQTPDGPKPMKNIIGRRTSMSGKAVAISGHYDTKVLPKFVGANDAGSSTGTLMELARVLPGQRWSDDVYLVFFDGEEAFHQWTDTDSLYGSRHLADRWAADGTLRRLKALINVDMIGDRNLDIVDETSGAVWLRQLVWQIAAELGHSKYFRTDENWIGDDHVPFVQKGVAALDLIDFNYGPGNEYWHTADDTMDKLGAQSFQVVGDVLVATLVKLQGHR